MRRRMNYKTRMLSRTRSRMRTRMGSTKKWRKRWRMNIEKGSHVVVLSVMLAHFDALQEIVVLSVREGCGFARLSAVFLEAIPPRLVMLRGTEVVVRTSQ